MLPLAGMLFNVVSGLVVDKASTLAKDHVTKMPFDHDLINQDENGVTTLCPHGEYPSYDANPQLVLKNVSLHLLFQQQRFPSDISIKGKCSLFQHMKVSLN